MNYDPFQKEAMSHIDNGETVIVSAPTGAGKTVIAEYAIDHAMKQKKEVIYTAPIKALSNQKYRDFRSLYGEKHVGILTGDVSINPYAPLIIMTTEIYRNTLLENSARVSKVSWVIFDEIHYLDDSERGTVWEESLMFSPPHINFIGLSATVPNINELALWIESIRHKPVRVITEESRPVPLTHFFQCQGKIITTQKGLKKEGFFNVDDWYTQIQKKRYFFKIHKVHPNRLATLVHHIQNKEYLPCIFFVFGRARAKYLAEEMTSFDFLTFEKRNHIVEFFWNLCERYGITEERSVKELAPLITRGIAYHHAGMLPSLKEVVEQLFTSKMIKLIFTTETFALGINMPARCVVFDELRKFYGTHFGNLRTRDYYQMAGRAGRRGMDECGFVFSRINPRYITYSAIMRIIYGSTEPVKSQFNATYATVLNLYKTYKRELLDIYTDSFHYYQSSKKKRRSGKDLLERKVSLLEHMEYIFNDAVTSKGNFASSLYGYELTISEMHESGFLEYTNEVDLGMLLSGLVFEPRKHDHAPPFSKSIKRLIRETERYTQYIRRQEKTFKVYPHTKACHFHLAPSIEAWMSGKSFSSLTAITSVDEGEIIRYFRMVIQLLRQLREAFGVSTSLKDTAQRALQLINKDIIDAEKQLKI